MNESEFEFECPCCHGSISAGPEWRGKSTRCPHCSQTIRVPGESQTHPLIAPAAVLPPSFPKEVIRIPATVIPVENAAVDRPWENDFFRFPCPHCQSVVRLQGLFFQENVAGCPDCGNVIELLKLKNLVPENPVPYKQSILTLLLSYRGRVSRRHFWTLGLLPLAVLPAVVGILAQPDGVIRELRTEIQVIFILLWLFPVGLPIMVKRFHDRGKSGHWAWLLLLVILPWLPSSGAFLPLELLGHLVRVVAPVLLLVSLGMFPGYNAVNRFGPPPSSVRYN